MEMRKPMAVRYRLVELRKANDAEAMTKRVTAERNRWIPGYPMNLLGLCARIDSLL